MTLAGEVRSFVEEKVERYTSEVKNIFEAAIKGQSSKPLSLDFKTVRENGGFKFSEDDPFVQNAVRIVESLGYPHNFIYSLGCYDANVFAEKGVQVLNFGWGGQNQHIETESVSLENIYGLGNLVLALSTDLNSWD